MTILFSKLLIAHLLGDFILFRKRLKEKGKPLWRSRRLAAHSLTHSILAAIALWDISCIGFAVLIGLAHYLGELTLRLLLHRRPQLAFVADQVFHLLLILFITKIIANPTYTFNINVPWITVVGFIAVTFPAAKVIEVFLSQWPPAKSASLSRSALRRSEVDRIRGLVNAGLWIGILERVLIYIFITTGHWEGIGFLLAAKSVFRFGDLTNSKDISLTEYIMVGTLMSFCLAVISGLLVNYLVA